MDRKAKPSREDSKQQDLPVESDRPAKKEAGGKPLRRAGEGPDNLRQRAEWFRRRQGGDK